MVTSVEAVVLWDVETLGSPGPVRPGRPDDVLPWLAEHEPHTWALVEEGQYAVGDPGAYLVARMTRGVHHVTLDPTAPARLSALGVPDDALPDVVAPGVEVATTEPSTFLGLAVPVLLAPPR
ncbi:hypothetical protein ABFT23_14540 [Nocardioides sp. C4-1]|uniref:hypothetical protein n=1 Tax=Nocardioides sp. C4-1 TaxID=3151851 RepID=UPI003265FC0E